MSTDHASMAFETIDNFVTDVTRRYTSQWTSVTRKLRVQPAGPAEFDWWAQTIAGLANPLPSVEEDLEEAELQQAEASERMPTKLGDFNNHPMYVLHPKCYFELNIVGCVDV